MRLVKTIVKLIAIMFIIGVCVILAMLMISWSTAWGAEYEIGWSAVTTYTTGAPLDTVPYYEVYRDGAFHAGTYDTTVIAFSDSTDRAYIYIKACIDGDNCSVPSATVSARTIDVLPGYTHEIVYQYIAPGELLVIEHPHILDELQISYTDSTETVYWYSYLDFDNSGYMDLSDVAEFGQLYIASHFSMGWDMIRLGGGDVNLVDLVTLGELLHGPAYRRMSFER